MVKIFHYYQVNSKRILPVEQGIWNLKSNIQMPTRSSVCLRHINTNYFYKSYQLLFHNFLICQNRRGQRISKGGGQDFKCCCVQENFEKLTLLVAFSDQFL